VEGAEEFGLAHPLFGIGFFDGRDRRNFLDGEVGVADAFIQLAPPLAQVQVVARMLKAVQVVEVGVLTGFSLGCSAKGVQHLEVG